MRHPHPLVLLTIGEAARILRVSKNTVSAKIRAREAGDEAAWPTTVVRAGRIVRIPTAELAEWLGATPDDLVAALQDEAA